MAKEIGNIKPDWGVVLSQSGVVVSLEIRWFKGAIRLAPEDLDLEKQATDPKFKELFSLGQKSLIPKEIFLAFHRVETRARAVLNKYSFETPFGQFVPYAAFPVLESKMNEVEGEFSELVKGFEKNFPKYKGKVFDDYQSIAAQVFTNGNRQEATQRLLNHIHTSMPKREELSDYFSFEWLAFHISTPKELIQNQRQAEKIRAEKDTRYVVNQKLAKEYENKASKAIDGFLKSAVSKMRGTVSELVNAALKSIEKNDGVLVPRLSTTLKDMVSQFKLLNFTNDEVIEKKLDGLKAYLADTDGDGPGRTAKAKELLKELKSELKEKIASENLFIRNVRKGVEL